jgi:shikimate kinase
MGPEAKTNIVLVGMSGAGKSTVGVLLAKWTARDFVDTDVLIQASQQRSLQDIVDREGYLALRRVEEQALLSLNLKNHVIATGGSAVYSPAAMAHLKKNGVVVFLGVELARLRERLGDFATRGIVRRPGQTLEQLFEERDILYRKYADITVPCTDMTHEHVCQEICARLAAH